MAAIVIVSPFAPLPVTSGDRKRLGGILRSIGRAHAVTLISPSPETAGIPTPDGVKTRLSLPLSGTDPETSYAELAQALRVHLDDAGAELVIVWGHSVAAAVDFEVKVPLVVDLSLIPTVLARRAAQTFRYRFHARYYFVAEERRARGQIAELLERYHVVACSEIDREHLLEIHSGRVHVVDNFADASLHERRRPAGERHAGAVVLLGPFDSLANRDALTWFSRRVMPQLRSRLGERPVTAVGKSSLPKVCRAAEQAGIQLKGWVDDLGDTLSRAALFAVPLRIGSGTKTRILDAGLLELPVVTTPVGAEGIPMKHRVHAMIAESEEEYADAVAEVLSNPRLAESLGSHLRSLVEERFLEDTAMQGYPHLVEAIMADPLTGASASVGAKAPQSG